MAKVMDEETLQYIMRSVTTNDRQLQRRVLDQYVTADVKFTHFLGDVHGREAMYGVYRAAATGINYKLKFIETIITDEIAAVWVDLNIKLFPFYLSRYHAPTIVFLRFRRCEDGLLRICEQVDHHSIFVFMWALGWPFSTIWDLVIRKIEGSILSGSGWAIDMVEDISSYLFKQGLSTTGWVVSKTLPGTMVQLISQTLGMVLPEGVVQQLGLSDQGFSERLAFGRDAAAIAPAAAGIYERTAEYGGSNSSSDRPTGQCNGGATVMPGGTAAALDAAAGSSTGAEAVAASTAATTPATTADKPGLQPATETLDKPAPQPINETLDKPAQSTATGPFPSVVAAAAAAEGKPPPGAPPTPTASEASDKPRSSTALSTGALDKTNQSHQPMTAAAETVDKPDLAVLPALENPEALAAETAAANETLKALADAAGEATAEDRAAAEAEVAANATDSLTALTATIAAEEPRALPTATAAAMQHKVNAAIGLNSKQQRSIGRTPAEPADMTVAAKEPEPKAATPGKGMESQAPAPSAEGPTSAAAAAAATATARAAESEDAQAVVPPPKHQPTTAPVPATASSTASSLKPSGPSRQVSKKKKTGQQQPTVAAPAASAAMPLPDSAASLGTDTTPSSAEPLAQTTASAPLSSSAVERALAGVVQEAESEVAAWPVTFPSDTAARQRLHYWSVS